MAALSRTAGAGKATPLLSLLVVAAVAVLSVTAVTAQVGDDTFDRPGLGVTAFNLQKLRRLTCPNYNNQQIWFYSYELNPDTPALPPPLTSADFTPYHFQADATALGGYRIIAPFTANDGATYTAAEGFDPCEHTTCAGVTCSEPGWEIMQNYPTPTDYYFVMSGANTLDYLMYDNWRVSNANIDSSTYRCLCINAAGDHASASGSTYIVVDPAGPAAEPSDAVCAGLFCNAAEPTDNVLYYLTSTDGTADGCQCCLKQPSSIFTVGEPECGAITPETTTTTTTEAATPDPVLPTADPASLITPFLATACPAGTFGTLNTTAIDAQSGSVCCYYTPTGASEAQHVCGSGLLDLAGPGVLNCVSTVPDNAFTCCADLAAGGTATTTGRYCKDSFGDSAVGAASALGPAVVAAAVALAAVALC